MRSNTLRKLFKGALTLLVILPSGASWSEPSESEIRTVNIAGQFVLDPFFRRPFSKNEFMMCSPLMQGYYLPLHHDEDLNPVYWDEHPSTDVVKRLETSLAKARSVGNSLTRNMPRWPAESSGELGPPGVVECFQLAGQCEISREKTPCHVEYDRLVKKHTGLEIKSATTRIEGVSYLHFSMKRLDGGRSFSPIRMENASIGGGSIVDNIGRNTVIPYCRFLFSPPEEIDIGKVRELPPCYTDPSEIVQKALDLLETVQSSKK